MPIFEFEGPRPDVDPSAWVAPTATLIGDVRIEKDASIWYGAVLRGDVGPIVVGEGSNVQDNSVLHVKNGLRLDIGPSSTVAHGCVVHGPIEADSNAARILARNAQGYVELMRLHRDGLRQVE